MTNDALSVVTDVSKQVATTAGQDVGALERLSNAGTVAGGAYTAWQMYVAVSTGNQDAAADAMFGSVTLVVSKIPAFGPAIATGMTLSNLILQLAFPLPPGAGSFIEVCDKYARPMRSAEHSTEPVKARDSV